MGKKKDAEKALSKKDRKKAEARAAELAAELARREAEAAAKAAKKDKKKAGKKKSKAAAEPSETTETVEPSGVEAEAIAAAKDRRAKKSKPETAAAGDPVTKASVIETADKILADPNTNDETRAAAETAREAAVEAGDDETDAEIKARVQRKRAERAAEAGSPERTAALQASVATARAERLAEAASEGGPAGDEASDELLAKPQTAEVVETETGREFAVGESVAEEFAKPSEAPRELEEGRNGYKIIMLDKDGKPDPRKVRQLTRVTTYVGNIDDETTLKKWDKRMVAEGLAADATAPESVGLIPKVNELAHRRDVKIAKARKADRKGKLGIGEVATLVADAEKEAKDALDAIVEEAAALAGRNDKANFGTHLHTLAEISDAEGIDRVRQLHESDELVAHDNDGKDGLVPMPVTATDVASIEAYAERMDRLGAKVIESEAVIVNDDLGYAGRLDRIISAKLPELVIARGTAHEYVRPADQRARRYITDIKSGRIDLGAGKIARQLTAYALGDLYDLETGERSKHRAATDVALVFHLPQGAGTCSVHAVDLKEGKRLLTLSGEVRRARNTGKKTIDTSVDVTDPAADAD